MTERFDRALLLIDQRRHGLAEEEVRRELAAAPGSSEGHALLALCLAEGDRLDEATEEARLAVHHGPEQAFAHQSLATVLAARNRFDEAAESILESIRTDGGRPDAFAVLARIRRSQRRWADCLAAAEQGLALDPADADCANLRAIALRGLGRPSDAADALAGALASDPEHALTHANRGWALLGEGRPGPALEHFREALRLRPELEWARRGIVEALKARNPIYGLMVRYFLWMGRLRPGSQWVVAIGAYVIFRLVRSVAETTPGLAPWLWPLIGVYLGFVFLTWVADPLFNLFLRLSPYGRLALSREERRAATWTGACLLATVGASILWLATDEPPALLVAIGAALLLIPIAGTYQCGAGWPRKTMAGFTVALSLIGFLGLACLVTAAAPPAVPVALGLSFLVGAVLSSWLANGLAMIVPRR